MLAHEIVYQGTAQGQTDRTQHIYKHSLNKWKSCINLQQEEGILAATNTTMEKLGFQHNTKKINTGPTVT